MRKISVDIQALIFVLLFAATVSFAQTPAPAAPVPSAILHAKTVFVANAGADAGLFPHPFSGTPNRAYNEFYIACRAAGFQLADDPANADLVLELRLTGPYGPSNADKTKGASDPLPMFRLVVYDARSHFLLWAVTEPIEGAMLQSTHDQNFDDALRTLVADFHALTLQKPPAQ